MIFMDKITIASWNINSVRARMGILSAWLPKATPDILLLQETKATDEDFPFLEIQALGYPHITTFGQKSYNGVAILSRLPLDDIRKGLPGENPESEARFISASVAGIRVASLYVPNGNPADGPAQPRKLAWLSLLNAHARELLRSGDDFIFSGDFNIIPNNIDMESPERWEEDSLTGPESRQAWKRLLWMGLTDAFRALHPKDPGYTFWDYQGGAWQKNDGIRIDHALLSPRLADRLLSCEVDKTPRAMEKASDHTPLVTTLARP